MDEWQKYTTEQLVQLFSEKFHQRYGTTPCYMDANNRTWIVEQLEKITDNVVRAEN